ncbi:MAG: T9SS type A sorting domain-containing protein, partial [Caldithrix sp.]|nr:T9SS type A sorting domain-containing protein [Caldithrix sp.]
FTVETSTAIAARASRSNAADNRLQVYPNPFNHRVQIRWSLPRATTVDLAVYNIRGRKIRHIMDGRYVGSGTHTWAWQGRNDQGQPVATGIYFLRLQYGDQQHWTRLVYLK